MLEIETYQDLYYALKSRKELKDSRNPQLSQLRESITKQLEDVLE